MLSREEAIKHGKEQLEVFGGEHREFIDIAAKALEQEPMEKFESVKDHIFKLAGDYKCWDNRLTYDEALELCHILEQQPNEDCVSRKAVLEMIEQIQDAGGFIGYNTYSEAFDRVDNMLSVTPTHLYCEDCVSRQAIFETIDDCNSDGLKGIFCSYDDGERFKQYIKALPSVTPARKVGKWIIDDKEGGRIWHCHCSNCKKDPQIYVGGSENWWLVRLPKYCPNCEAEMESEE